MTEICEAAAAESCVQSNGVGNHVDENDVNGSKSLSEMNDHKGSGDFSTASKSDIKKEHRHSSSSSSSKHKDKDRKHHSSSSKDRHRDGHSSSSHKHHSSSSHKHKDKHSSKESSGKTSSSSSSKDKHSSHSSSKSKDGHSSSHKHKHSSSSSKHRESSSDKHKHHEKSSTHKSSSSSEKRDKDRSHSEHKHKSNTDKPKTVNSSSSPSKSSGPTQKITTEDVDGIALKQEMNSVKQEQFSPVKLKEEPISPMKTEKMCIDSDDDLPLSSRRDSKIKEESKIKVELPVKHAAEDSDDEPLSARMTKKIKKENKLKDKKRKLDEDDDFAPKKKKKKVVKEEKNVKKSPALATKKAQKKAEEEATKWKWWEEDRKEDGTKWRSLEHKGPVFAAPYEPIPDDVRFFYEGDVMQLTQDTEEVATFYARMLDHDYTSKEIFNRNFFKDWRKVMSDKERKIITNLSKCNFKEMHRYFQQQSEARKNMTKAEKQVIKEQNAAITEEYGFCIIDHHKQKIGNFRIEPPGLFRGRGEHPKQGMLKKRTMPEEVIINCSKDSNIPKPPEGHRWREVRHDNKVTWLACWNENIQGSTKYVMLNAASKLKGEKDWQKYETARKLRKCVDKIRTDYYGDFKSKEMRVRQRSVALYFIDKLALRAGNEKDEDQADTVGCCSLRVEHIKLHEKSGDKEFVVVFDFLGKDSIRYYNEVSVEKRVFRNLELFMENKQDGDDLFDRLNTAILNKHLQNLMDGLTAKVFRTFNASKTLQEQLDLLTDATDPVPAKLLSYNRANRAVAVLCNHQRAAPKNFDEQMQRMQDKVESKKDAISAAKKAVKDAKTDLKKLRTEKCKKVLEQKKKAVDRLLDQLTKLEVQQTDKDENKEIALGTSKLNYLDPRISVAWCKKWDVPVEKVYNKTQREKFAWAIDMVDDEFVF